MRKHVFFLLLAVVMVSLVFEGCSGGGGGGAYLPPAAQPLATGTFVKTPADVSFSQTSFFDTRPDVHFQNLYTASSVSASGRLTGIAFKYSAAVTSAVTCTGVTIKVGHTGVSSLTSSFAGNVGTSNGGQTTVLANGTLTFPAAAIGTWQKISFTTAIDYNGQDNLVVEFVRPYACSDDLFTSVTLEAYNANVYSSIKGASAGTPGPWVQNTRLTFSGGDDVVELGGSDNSVATPFGNEMRLQGVYLASEIMGNGPITGLGFKTYATTTTGAYTYTLKLGHTVRSQLSTTFADNYSGSPVTVVSNGTITIPAGVPANTYIWIPFPGSFTYNGSENLLIDLDMSHASALNPMLYTSGVGTARTVGGKGAAVDASDGVFHAKFRFHGGPVSVITDGGGGGTSLAFDVGPAGRLNLYRATELGSAGNITSIACRLETAPTATSYSNYRVIIGHSSVDSLSSAAADNFISQTTALNGTVAVPAGLLAGDWLEVPLSTPFAYDGTSNLAIWMGTTAASGASGDTLCRVSTADAARYPGHMGNAVPGAASLYVQNYKFDMKLQMTR